MTLPAPPPRKHLHTRRVVFDGYERDDGMWDIEARVTDTKAYLLDSPERGPLEPGTPVHDMHIRVTLDDSMTIREIHVDMASSPFPECPRAEDPMQQMVGLKMGPGWRFAVEKVLGGTRGCTHLRELLFNMATAAYQTVTSYRMQKKIVAGIDPFADGKPPHHLGKCMSWDFDGPVTARHYPKFAGWKPLTRVVKEE